MTLTTCEHLINWLFYLVGPKFLQKSIIQSPAYIYTSHRVSGNTVRKGRYEDVLQFKVCILITSKSFPFFKSVLSQPPYPSIPGLRGMIAWLCKEKMVPWNKTTLYLLVANALDVSFFLHFSLQILGLSEVLYTDYLFPNLRTLNYYCLHFV